MEYSIIAIGWMIKLFLIYTLLVVIMPYILLRPVLRGKAASLQFLICVISGNFYYINVVLFLGLFHITSGRVYIFLFLIPLVVKIICMRKRIWEVYVSPLTKRMTGIVRREISMRFCLHQLVRWLKNRVKEYMCPIWRRIRRNSVEVILFGICILFFVMYFAPYFYEHYGYKAWDIVVHQQWITGLEEGILFYDGIYPIGMHAIIYYIHAVFGIHTYPLLQFFPFVSATYVFCMLLVTMKAVCSFKYLPYLGFFVYVGTDYIGGEMLIRYLSALPQEFGMMFYLPCLVAAIQFFRTSEKEKTDDLKRKKESTLWLWVLIASFGLTFAVHFYITILAGILILAVAIGYLRDVFKPACFKKLLIAFLISILIPITPMVVSFVGGVPLQGSLYWATAVMGIDLKEKMTGVSSFEDREASESLSNPEDAVPANAPAEKKTQVSFVQQLKNIVIKIKDGLDRFYVDEYSVLKDDRTYRIFIISLAIIFIQIFVMIWMKEREYRRILTIVLVNQCLLMLMGITGKLGLPVLIDSERMAAFQAYVLPISIALAVDSLLLIGFRFFQKEKLWQVFSAGLTICFIGTSIFCGNIRKATPIKSSVQTDGASMCLADILQKYPEDKWTIVSCNEERNMMAGSGWHYEVIDFLQSMEHYDGDEIMKIPTQYVFFFIEKESLNYEKGEWDDSIDPTVSETWAEEVLPRKHKVDQYSGTNRIILNSRMYYWMQEYQKCYPNEMKVYYEDDEFICYFMEQNEYYLHNFAIDYGYNTR